MFIHMAQISLDYEAVAYRPTAIRHVYSVSTFGLDMTEFADENGIYLPGMSGQEILPLAKISDLTPKYAGCTAAKPSRTTPPSG